MNIETGFEEQKKKQSALIAASIFNLHRYSKMSDKKLREGLGGASAIPDDAEMRTYVMSKEVKDILSYQANIRLLDRLNKKYGAIDVTTNIVSDIQRDFGITTESKTK